jgi:hypothetical protein
MKKLFLDFSLAKAAPVLGLAMVVLLVGSPVVAEDLEDLLVQVGEEYAMAYASPFIEAFGPNQNSALYQDAHIPWGGLKFGIGIKVMGSHLNEADQTFQKNVRVDDLGDFDSSLDGQAGTVIFAGPTIFGDTNTNGSITLLPDSGLPVALEGIPGLVETRFVPLAAPEVFVGGVFGLKGTLRWFPEMSMGDYGKSKYLGYGLQWSPNGLLATLPVDLSVGFFKQEIKVGTLIETSASSMFLAASKDLGAVTVYGGLAKEDADMTVSYIYEDTGENVSFEATARQESRFTLGARLGFFNVEMAHGDLTTYSAGLMLGI